MKSPLQIGPVLLALAALVFVLLCQSADSVFAASGPLVAIDVAKAGPRQVEDTTQRAVARDYANAWQAMADALEQNRADLLSANFIGTANDKLTATVREQGKNGLHQRIVDQGHTVDAVFYSSEGSAIELHDTARLQLQLVDGDRVVQSEDATLHFVVLLTAAENSWKVRVLEAVPAF
jgi:hypothetical protein